MINQPNRRKGGEEMNKKTYYKVTSKFYDNGKMETTTETVFLNEKPNNEFSSNKDYDLYVDYFEKLKDAQAYIKEEA